MKLRGGSLLLVLAWGARCDVQPVLSWKTILLGGDDIQVTGATTSPDGVLVAGKTYDLDLGDALAPFSIADATTNIAVFDPTTAALSNVRSLPDRNLRNFAFDQSSGLAYFGSSTHIFRYSADGAWKDVAKSIPGVGETGAIIQLLIATGNGVYAATVSTGGAGTKRSYYYSPDAGETWEQGDARIELAEAADPFDSCRLLTATSASQDCGKTWLDQKEANPAVRVAMPDPRVKDLLYAWSIFAEADGRFRLYRSRDWGKSWESLQTFSAAGSIAPDPADPFGLYMANADGVYQSGDRGTNWSRIGAPPLTNGSARFQLIGDFVSAAMYLNIHDGFGKVYVSRDGMRSFSRIAEQTSPLLAALTGDGRLLIHRDALPVGFVAKFSWDGAPMFFRYLPAGGYMYITGSGIAPTGEIVISGFGYFPRGFPATSELPVVDQNLNDGFVLRISSDGQQLLSSTRTARPFTQAIGGDGSIYLAGSEIMKLRPDASAAVFSRPHPATSPPQCLAVTKDGGLKVVTRDDRNARNGYSSSLATLGPTGETVAAESLGAVNACQALLLENGDILMTGANADQRNYVTSSGAFQATPPIFAPQLLPSLPSPTLRDGYILRLGPDGEVRAGTLLGGENLDWITGAAATPEGGIVAVGMTDSRQFPVRNLLETRQSSGVGFVAKLNATMSSLIYSTFLNRFAPAGVFPGAGGGYLIVGYGRARDSGDGPDGIVFARLTEGPARLPRIDSAMRDAPERSSEFLLRAGDTLAIKGEGFAAGSVVVLDGTVLESAFVSAAELRARVPAGTPVGPAVLRVETDGKQSQAVSVAISN